MAERSTIARPYAQAVFELARERGELEAWSERLALLAAVVRDERVRRLVGDPRLGREGAVRLILDIAGERLGEEGARLVRLLAENGKLALAPEIAQLYEARRAEAERRVEAEVRSAFPLDEAQQRALAEGLRRRLGREVSLRCQVDTSLLGGVVVRAGDWVLDGSVAGRLRRLASELAR